MPAPLRTAPENTCQRTASSSRWLGVIFSLGPLAFLSTGCDPTPEEEPAGQVDASEGTQDGDPEPTRTAFERVVTARTFSYGEYPVPDRIVVEVSAAGLGRTIIMFEGATTDLEDEEPGRVRANFETGGRTVLRRRDGSLHTWSADQELADASEEQSAQFQDLLRLCELALMRPLEDLEPEACEPFPGDLNDTYRVRGLRVEVTEDRVSKIDDLRFLEFARAGRGQIPVLLENDALGQIGFRILAHDLLFGASSFEPPDDREDVVRRLIEPIRQASVRRIERVEAQLLWIPDPGTWQGRFEALNEAGARLGAGGFAPAGEDAALVTRNGQQFLQIAFLDPTGEGKLKLDENERQSSREAGSALSVRVPDGDWTRRIDLAEAALRSALQDRAPDGNAPELLFNHRTRSLRQDGDLMLETMPVELRQGLK